MQWAAAIPAKIIDFALPPRCPGCGCIVGRDLEFCVACWASLDFLTSADACDRCGVPVSPGIAICAPCLQSPPDHDGALAAVVYGDVARHMVLRLKHGRRIGLARLFAKLMAGKIDGRKGVLVPVPLHRGRIWQRGFNQSALIARHVSGLTGLPLALGALQRTRATPMLKSFGAADRAKAVKGAFAVAPSAAASIAGQTVFLVDDVYTSGATANACARVLKRSKAAKVIILCWARVPLGDASN